MKIKDINDLAVMIVSLVLAIVLLLTGCGADTVNNNVENKDNYEMLNKDITNVDAIDSKKINKSMYEKLGENSIKNGQLAVCSMAGGQGTRLGFNGPKATYMLDIGRQASIFEIMTQKLKEAKEKYGVHIKWYIMTSEQNNDETVAFFEKNNYFGYDKNYIKFFKQG